MDKVIYEWRGAIIYLAIFKLMNQTNFHNQPSVIIKEKEAYRFWLILHKNIPKTERFNLGQKINSLFIDILELSFVSLYLPPEQKIIMLGKTISRLDLLKFFMQLAWESKLIPTDKFTALSQKLEEIGRILGGWKKGLQSKTPGK